MNPKQRLYVTDTHSLIWYFLAPAKLSRAADSAFKQVEASKAKLLIPAIVIQEDVIGRVILRVWPPWRVTNNLSISNHHPWLSALG